MYLTYIASRDNKRMMMLLRLKMRWLLFAGVGTTALVVQTQHPAPRSGRRLGATTIEDVESMATPGFGETLETEELRLKAKILQLGATLDRGQGYNPTSGEQYKDRMERAVAEVEALIEAGAGSGKDRATLEGLAGRWELVFSSVPHGIFRSSPFFQAIDNAYRSVGAPDKAALFFKLHELQTCSWGVSKIGRVGQTIDPDAKLLYSEFDTQLLSLTVIPILGWFKLLPTFGGCVVTVSKIVHLQPDAPKPTLSLEVDYTTAKPVDNLSGLGDWIWNVKVPVGAVWKLLPWNRGLPPTCDIDVCYLDDDFRVVKDPGGDYFVYTRPVL